eukprot:818300-Pyramimonas_sp.AAC.1
MRLNVGLAAPLHVVSLHLVTSIGLAKQNIDILTQLMEYLGSLPGPWIVLGDFNMLPEGVQGWALRAQAILLTTGAPTCGGREIDFGVCSRVLSGFIHAVVPMEGSTLQTHIPVHVRLRGLGRQA